MIYTCDAVTSILLMKHVLPSDIKGYSLELNFRKGRWLPLGSFHPPS